MNDSIERVQAMIKSELGGRVCCGHLIGSARARLCQQRDQCRGKEVIKRVKGLEERTDSK